MLKFQKLEMQNFLSFQKASFDFDEDITLLLGDNKDSAAADDNGSGKSSVAEALRWVLFEDTVRRELDKSLTVTHVIRNGASEARVTLDMEALGSPVQVTRVRSKKGGSLRVCLDGEEMTGKEAEDALETILGIDVVQFSNLVHLDGSYPRLFAPSTDAERKKILGSLLDAPIWDAVQEEINHRLAKVQGSHQTLQQNMEQAEALAKYAQEQMLKIKEEGKQAAEAKKHYRVQLKQEQAKLVDLEVKKESTKQNLDSLGDAVTKALYDNNQEVEQTREVLREAERQLAVTQKERLVLAISDGEKISNALRHQLGVVEHDLDEIEKLQALGKCTLCGQDTTDAKQSDVKHLLETQTDLEEALHEQQANVDRLKKEREQEILKSTIIREVAQERYEAAVEQLRSTRQPYENNIKGLRIKLDGINDQITKQKVAIQRVQSQLDQATQTLKRCEGHWAEAKEDKTNYEETKKETLDRLQGLSGEIESLEFWKKGFGPKGVPSLFIELVLPNISERIQKYADILTGGDIIVTLKAYSETQKKTVKEAIQISAVNVNGASVYGANSAGERNRINLAVTLGLIEYFREVGVFSSSLLICDEVFDGLDSTGVETALTALTAANMTSVLVISHHEQFKPLFSKVKYVTKEQGISSIRS